MIQYYAIPGLKQCPLIPFRMLPEHIIGTAEQVTGYSRVQIFAHSRIHNMVLVRYAIMKLLRDKTYLSYKEIGKLFGTDHSNVIHACKYIQAGGRKSEPLMQLIERIKTQLKY